MKIQHINPLTMIMALAFMLLVMILPSHNVMASDNVSVASMGDWYSCDQGNYQSACDAIEIANSASYADSIGNSYACAQGNYQPACDTFDVATTNASTQVLGNWYACNQGNYQPACETIAQNDIF